MSGSRKFYICEHCGNIIGLIENKGVPLICCGEKMLELVANIKEAAVEKHLPVVTQNGNELTVCVGSVAHPMTEEHHISFVYVETQNGGQRKCTPVNSNPEVKFAFVDDKPIAVYAYCNLHGLWKTEV